MLINHIKFHLFSDIQKNAHILIIWIHYSDKEQLKRATSNCYLLLNATFLGKMLLQNIGTWFRCPPIINIFHIQFFANWKLNICKVTTCYTSEKFYTVKWQQIPSGIKISWFNTQKKLRRFTPWKNKQKLRITHYFLHVSRR